MRVFPATSFFEEQIMDRAAAFALLIEYVKDPGLVRHMRAVEIGMRAYARKLNEDEEKWGLVGLLHDFDYGRWPDPPDHPSQDREGQTVCLPPESPAKRR